MPDLMLGTSKTPKGPKEANKNIQFNGCFYSYQTADAKESNVFHHQPSLYVSPIGSSGLGTLHTPVSILLHR